MQNVKIITHSGCDLTQDMVTGLDINILPDLVVFGDEQYLNHVSIHPEEFYARIESGDVFPTSAHPTLSDFMNAFRSAAQDHEEILCIVMSSQMTSTVNTATLAANLLKEEEDFASRIYIYDSMQVSFGMGFAVYQAAEMAKAGASAQQIIDFLDELVPRIGVYFVMNSLKYARKGGRVGAIRAIGADALGVKPLLSFRNGTVSDIKLNRRFSDGVQAIFKKYQTLADLDSPDVYIFHACNEKDALQLEEWIRAFNPKARTRLHIVGPVVGIYTGIGCVGISFKEKEPK